jgi:hypothetical protein
MRSGSNTTLEGTDTGGALVDTELPDPVVLSDSMNNPTVPQVGAHVLGWDSVNSIWKRVQTTPLFDVDTSGSTHQYVPGFTLRLAASGGSVPFGTAANPINVVADIAAGVADSGNPFKIGGRASSTTPAAVTDGQRVNAWYDLKGRLVTRKTFENYNDIYTVAPTTGVLKTYIDNPAMFYSLQISGNGGAATAWTVILEGSNDFINYYPIITHATADLDGTNKTAGPIPYIYFRTRCTVLTLAGGQAFITSSVTMVTT